MVNVCFVFLLCMVNVLALANDSVDSLPGYGKLKELSYAGYAQVDSATHASLFYWFFASREKSDSTTPIVLWLNGGPGASSLFGLLYENGPYLLQEDLSLSDNPFGWNQKVHLLYIDNPVGTGYSFCDKNGYVQNEEQLSSEFYNGLVAFYKLHPEYKSNPLWLVGESYAGKYLPNIATYIHKKNEVDDVKIPLTGVAIGNGGLISPLEQFRSVPDYNLGAGLIDDSQWVQTQKMLDECATLFEQKKYGAAFNSCNEVSNKALAWGGNPFLYDIRRAGIPDPFASFTDLMDKYLNKPEVKKALHIDSIHKWKPNSDGTSSPNPVADALFDDFMKPIIHLIPDLLANYPILFYNGIFDSSAWNHLGMSRTLEHMKWDGFSEYNMAKRTFWKPHLGQPVAAILKKAKNLRFAIIPYAGHLVPADVPDSARELIYSFINGTLY